MLNSAGNSKLYINISTSFLFVAFYTFTNKEMETRMRMLDYYPRHEMSGCIYLHFLKNTLPSSEKIIEKI